MRRTSVVLALMAMVVSLLVTSPQASAAPRSGEGLEVYVGEVTPSQLDQLSALGLDREDVATGRTRNGALRVEAIITTGEAAKLRADGIDLRVKRIDGQKASDVLAQQARDGYSAFRSYSEPGGIRDELVATAAAHPRLTKLVNIGTSVNGQKIYALKVTRNARQLRDGRRPSVLYGGAQHAREWITPEMVRRLMHHYLDGYGSDRQLTRIVDTTELWFLPVSNPDGYDFTFTEGNRLWRKNLRDNNGDGVITPGDGVDLNRNFQTKWGYDNEGSSPEPSSETYRGPSPASEPETKALDGLFGKVGFEFYVN